MELLLDPLFLNIAINIVIGFAIGIVLGLTGAGGSVFAVPLFLLFTSMTVTDSMGIALGAVAVSASYATISGSYKLVLWVPALLLAAGGMLTAPLGKWLATNMNENVLLAGFTLLAFTIGIRMWQQSKANPMDAAVVRGDKSMLAEKPDGLLCRLSPTGQFQLKPRCLSGLVLGGLAIGFMSGLFGVGGGFLIIPLLLYLSQLNMKIAVATSLFIIAMISSVGFASHVYFTDEMDWVLLFQIMLASIGGMIVSQLFSKKIAGARLQQIFSVSLILVSLLTLFGRLL